MSATSYSILQTVGTDTVEDVGIESSYFFPVKISIPTIEALAEPCFPGFAVEYSLTLQGNPFSIQYPPFLIEPAWVGVQSAEPASTLANYY